MYGTVTESWGKQTNNWANPEDRDKQKSLLPSDNKTSNLNDKIRKTNAYNKERKRRIPCLNVLLITHNRGN